jgi:hypothetical protein
LESLSPLCWLYVEFESEPDSKSLSVDYSDGAKKMGGNSRKISELVHQLQKQTARSYKSENMRMVKILFSLEGRINRAEFWVGLISIALFSVLMFSLGRHVSALGGQGPEF